MKGHLKSIRYKLILILLLCSILPLSFSMCITYIYSRNNFSNEIISYNEQLMYQFSNNINTYLCDVSDGIYYPFSNAKMYSFLTKKDSSHYNDHNTIMTFMQSIQNLSNDIESISLQCIKKNKTYIFQNRDLLTASLSDSVSFPGDYTAHIFSSRNSKDNYSVSIYLNLQSIPENTPIGALTITLSSVSFEKLSKDMLTASDEAIYVINNSSETVLYSTNNVLSNKIPSEINNIAHQLSASGNYQKYTDNKQSKFIFYKTIEVLNTPITIIKTVPLTNAYESIFQILNIYLPTYIAFLFLSILITWHFSKSLTTPIILLTKQMKDIKQGKSYAPLELNSNDEIRVLNDSFNSMIETIQLLKIDKYELELSIKDAQLRMLQAQLNPHFMNNTLQSLGTLALQNNSPELYSLITNLSLMMNYAMDIQHPLISLQSEFDYAQRYLIFQRQRFGENFHFDLNPDPDTVSLMVPKMILQPIMENYFKHGFVKRPEGYYICATSHLNNGILTVLVENNGKSLSKKELDNLQLMFHSIKYNQYKEKEKGIGLDNIQTRLNMYYHNASSVSVENISPYGVCIKITLFLEEPANEIADY